MKMKRLSVFVLLLSSLLSAAANPGSFNMAPLLSRLSGASALPQDSCPAPSEVCPLCGYAHQHMISSDEARQLLDSIQPSPEIARHYATFPPMVNAPLVYSGYRSLRVPRLKPAPLVFKMDARSIAYDKDRYAGILYSEPIDSTALAEGDEILIFKSETLGDSVASKADKDFKVIPDWLTIALKAERINADLMYNFMVNNPFAIDYTSWELPEPPTLPEEDHSFGAFIKSLDLPDIDAGKAIIPEFEHRHINWLHTVGGSLQFSQAYISSNWYQGGNNYLALLFNFNWDVVLNTYFHPNLMFQSNLAYKLALNSNPSEALHKYSISQDLFQYNLKMGVKAFKKWFYSFNLQFKTQLFNAYPSDSPNIAASIFSPADLNIGIGMTYNLTKPKKNLTFGASISPISYNLKTCISDRIDHLQFNIAADRHTASEIGSNAELNLSWNITSNISWKSRLFLFTNYKYFLADWENTVVFNINKFLSTQIYLHPRFDSSSDFNSSKWHYWSLKEILSFGLSYTFSTKP